VAAVAVRLGPLSSGALAALLAARSVAARGLKDGRTHGWDRPNPSGLSALAATVRSG
jgi:hypothetical protein